MNIEDFKPVKFDRHGPLYLASDVNDVVCNSLMSTNYFQRKIKLKVTPDYEAGAANLAEAAQLFDRNQEAMLTSMRKLTDTAKKASGNVRSAAAELLSGLQKIEKQANFDKLERYVDLLERAAKAMAMLAELEKTGRLDKISAALR